MITEKIIQKELGVLVKVLSYSGLKSVSFWKSVWPGLMLCSWFVFWPLMFFSGRLYSPFNISEERLGVVVSIGTSFVLGLLSLIFIGSARSLYLSAPYSFRINSKMYFFLSKKIKRYAAVFSFWYAVLVVFCALFNLSAICFLSAIIASVIGFSVYMNIDFNRYKINELAYILTPCKRVGESIISTSSSFDGIKIDEHNPATGLPMNGGVDVAGNPYGYSRHE